MRQHRIVTSALLLLVFLGGCGALAEADSSSGGSAAPSGRPGTAGVFASSEESFSASSGSADTVEVLARFLQEDGEAFADGTVQISDGRNHTDYSLDESGGVRAAGLPRDEAYTLVLLDGEDKERGSAGLQFATGAVIDAVTDEDGTALVTLKQDTDEVALDFTLQEGGALQCSLRLSGT